MSRSHCARILLALLVVAVISAPPAWGEPLRLSSEISPFDIISRVWGSLAALWAKEGCIIDPHGRCVLTPPPTLDAGCTLDPHGDCTAVQDGVRAIPFTTEAGCILDPHGVCASGNWTGLR